MVDADELLEQARDAILTTIVSSCLSESAIRELASATATFAAQFAREVLKENVR